jgi:hypothetical protein
METFTTVTTLTNDIKIRAKKLFKTAFSLNKTFISINDIKALFPAFDGRKATHWFNLIDKCETKLQEIEKATKAKELSEMSLADFNAYCHELVQEAAKKYECSVGDVNWLGYSTKLHAKDSNGVSRVIGSLHINRQSVVSITWTRSMMPKVCSNIGQGFQILLSMFRKPVVAVAA